MNTFTLNSIEDLYALKKANKSYDEINIDLKKIKQKGVIRHAVKYSMFHLRDDGKISIVTHPFKAYSFIRNYIDYWQVKYEVLNSLKDSVLIEEVDPETGTLVIRKKKDLYKYNGITFGIVFSGNESEETQLINQLSSIISNDQYQKAASEIIICGPSGYDPSKVVNQFINQRVTYLPLDISTSPRLMICEKKNYLYSQAAYTLIIIAHTRILFPENFIKDLFQNPIEMATPAVWFKNNNKEYKYLDFGFFDRYQDIQLGARRVPVAGENINDDYLHWFKKRVPYIDGGLNIFNKNVIPDPPYNNYIAWGEAEDVDVCNRLFQQGILIDYLPDIKCFSATCKITGYNNGFKKIGRRLYHYINKKGI